MKLVRLKTLVMFLAIAALFSVPSQAGNFSAFGAFWDSKDADASWGAGLRAGFNLTNMLELEFHGTYYPDFKDDQFPGTSIELTAIPIDGGLRFNFLPDHNFNPFVGGGVSYYFLSTSPGEVEDQTGFYLNGGFDIGPRDGTRFFTEVLWRTVDTVIDFGSANNDVDFDGFGVNFGVTWHWGE